MDWLTILMTYPTKDVHRDQARHYQRKAARRRQSTEEPQSKTPAANVQSQGTPTS